MRELLHQDTWHSICKETLSIFFSEIGPTFKNKDSKRGFLQRITILNYFQWTVLKRTLFFLGVKIFFNYLFNGKIPWMLKILHETIGAKEALFLSDPPPSSQCLHPPGLNKALVYKCDRMSIWQCPCRTRLSFWVLNIIMLKKNFLNVVNRSMSALLRKMNLLYAL